MTDENDDLLGYVTISDLARRRGVDKSAISRRVTRLESQGHLSTKSTNSGKYVNLAEFERAVATTKDAVREANGKGSPTVEPALPPGLAPGDPILAREQAHRARYEAEMRRLDLEERQGRIVEVAKVREQLAEAHAELRQIIELAPENADEFAAIVGRSGSAGLRAALRTFARDLLNAMSRAMDAFAEAPEVSIEAEPVAAAAAERVA